MPVPRLKHMYNAQ